MTETHAKKFGVSCATCFFFHVGPGREAGGCLLTPPPNVNSSDEFVDFDYDFVVSVPASNFCQSWRLSSDPRVDLLSRIHARIDLTDRLKAAP